VYKFTTEQTLKIYGDVHSWLCVFWGIGGADTIAVAGSDWSLCPGTLDRGVYLSTLASSPIKKAPKRLKIN